MADQDTHPAIVWMSSLEKGRLLDDIWAAVRATTAATARTRKPSSFSVQFAIQRLDLEDDEDPRRDVQCAINQRIAVPKRGHSTMFVTEDGGLARYDPRQSRFKFMMPRPPVDDAVPAYAAQQNGAPQ